MVRLLLDLKQKSIAMNNSLISSQLYGQDSIITQWGTWLTEVIPRQERKEAYLILPVSVFTWHMLNRHLFNFLKTIFWR